MPMERRGRRAHREEGLERVGNERATAYALRELFLPIPSATSAFNILRPPAEPVG